MVRLAVRGPPSVRAIGPDTVKMVEEGDDVTQ
jgi:hypothetical protein